jgi:uncharacterized protein
LRRRPGCAYRSTIEWIPMQGIAQLVSRQTQLPHKGVEAAVRLFDQGATVPFVARYRQGPTGGLDEAQLRAVQKAHRYFQDLEERKQTILRTIEQQGQLTEALRGQIQACQDANQLEDLYLPYKPKRKTKATTARENGLEPLAELIKTATEGDQEAIKRRFIQGAICTPKEALTGAQYILAEELTEDAAIREQVRQEMQQTAEVRAKKRDTGHKEAQKFELYEDFSENINRLRPHQILALNRGENLEILSVKLQAEEATLQQQIARRIGLSQQLLFYEAYQEAIKLAVNRYLAPAIGRELRKELNAVADKHAAGVFAENLRNLLMQPPLAGHVILGIDPGFASGCKVAVIDAYGDYQTDDIIYPVPPKQDVKGAQRKVRELIDAYGVTLIVIGNGTASRETEQFVANLIQQQKLAVKYLVTNEAGASVYSASELAAKEFPQLQAAARGTISIARRVLDPLSELIKIDPKSMGVGLYQHDIDQKLLDEELTAVVESSVNEVGVDVNTASPTLLSYVSGLNTRLANNIVAWRNQHGHFDRREQLKNVQGIGERVFEQAAGFLRIRGGSEPLDNTAVHPESYPAVRQLASAMNMPTDQLSALALALGKLGKQRRQQLIEQTGLDAPTFQLIVASLTKPGRDPREDAPAPVLRSDILSIEDLQEGMQMQGTVRNVVDFGAFVDIGLKNDALLHISQLGGKRRVKNPHEEVAVGDVLPVQILNIDLEKGRVGLTLQRPSAT